MDNLVSTMAPSTASEGLTNGKLFLYILSAIFPFLFFIFDALLLAATIYNRRDSSLPLTYICVMCTIGMLTTFFMVLNTSIFLVLPQASYEAYLMAFGRETTLAGTFSYLTALFITVLMTINRVYIVIKPFNNELFNQRRVFVYCGIISSLVLTSLIIPYFSSCYVVFRVDLLSFVSGCAPNRHPITVFQNTYAIILPFTCMFINLGIIFHLRFSRSGTYAKWSKFFCKNKVTTVIIGQATQKTALSKMQARRDLIMMRQTISVAVYLSIYELGAFIMKTFPNEYAMLPAIVRDGYFYFRYESVPLMNFFIYYVETGSTRRMFRRFLNIKDKISDSYVNPTVITVAPRAQPVRGVSATGAMSSPTV
ncbi:CRE-SRXA-9 protein [Caenorhabditis remanei]|uniref:CRE-SRXA-9 protein n=1 Tax=Caenorhabditis remanei TaxID=31234 RepID=E3MJE0_CAERE|nr:CRE-SRXA-9 protein [Caenorhabditis remanei]